MKFPTFLAIFIVFIIWFAYQRKRNERKNSEDKKSFWDQEASANFTRKQPLSNLDYITIPIKILPFIEINDSSLSKYYSTLLDLTTRKIVNLTGITNTQLKLKYGAPNLPLLMEYDENYTLLVRTLNYYATRLNELGYTEDARIVLEYAICINTDISDSYKALANIYVKMGEFTKIDELICEAEKLNSLSKSSIKKYLLDLKNSSMT